MLDTAWVALSLADHIGGKTLRALIHYFGDTHAILAATPQELQCVSGVGPKIAQIIQAINLQQIEIAIERWQSAGIHILTLQHPNYPVRLLKVDDAPATLFVRGQWPPRRERSAAIVGTRTPSSQSMQIARELAVILSERGCTVVSGLAFGVDTQAHMGAVLSPQGYTLAVLGSGILNIYPLPNQHLAERILSCGALLGEVNPHMGPNAANLVARNRIISGLSDALIVVETETDGGAMHAARRAQEQGRTVIAVDNPASGNQALLEQGALCLNADLSNLDTVFDTFLQ